jgi:hypothetical protein
VVVCRQYVPDFETKRLLLQCVAPFPICQITAKSTLCSLYERIALVFFVRFIVFIVQG